MRYRSSLIAGSIAALALAGAAIRSTGNYQAAAPRRIGEVEADWTAQDRARVAWGGTVSTVDDAAGAVDGITDGRWGFHTNLQMDPWWQVDLGAVSALDRVVVYNRCDTADRNTNLRILLSSDGAAWTEVYRHNGTQFFGATDGKPLVVKVAGQSARYVRAMVPGMAYHHLDEVQVYGTADPSANLALFKPADQCSTSQWSVRHFRAKDRPANLDEVLKRGRALVADMRRMGVSADECAAALDRAEKGGNADTATVKAARWAVRRLALRNPLLDFDKILFCKRAPGVFSHMSDQYYGWWSRPGGGIYILEGFREDRPRVRCLTAGLPSGSFVDPELSYDGRKVLFGYCRYYAGLTATVNKVDKAHLPEEGFYHLYEMNIDGTGLRRLTTGRYDDFDGRYLPDGNVAFLSTRRGADVQCGPPRLMSASLEGRADSYVRCGGDHQRPVAVYTLHLLNRRANTVRAISPFENFEWTPSIDHAGRILYARWDYVDRSNMPYMSLWSTNPDGTNPQTVYGNYTPNKHCVFEARAIPGSRKIVYTASGHHSITGGSLVLLDPARGLDGPEPIKRLTPEVCFPEIEGWPACYYGTPYPLSEQYYLTAFSPRPIAPQGGLNNVNDMGVYLYDAFGNLELLYRDPDITSVSPIPVRPRPVPPSVAGSVKWAGGQEGRMLLLDVYAGLKGVPRGSVKQLRVVAIPAKTQPEMHTPELGQTRDDPGKCVLGTVPVDGDGSAYFRVPSGVPLFLQALDADGMAIQTMRSATYVQPGQTLSCGGCHERRTGTPGNRRAVAAARVPSRLTPGPAGSWPLRFDELVQPVLDRSCVGCHGPGGAAARFDLSKPVPAYNSLVMYGAPSLCDHVMARYAQGRSMAGQGAARTSALLAMLASGHHGVRLGREDTGRLVTWMDTYAQMRGSFSEEQEKELKQLRRDWAGMLAE